MGGGSLITLSDIGRLFAFFSSCFTSPPDEDTQFISDFPSFAPLCELLPDLGHFAPDSGRADESRSKLGKEYRELFEGMRFPPLALWDSCYEPGDGRLFGRSTLSAVSFYRAAGLRADESLGPPDHIGVECAFFARLCALGDCDDAQKFFETRLGPFAAKFGAALEERASSQTYKTLARLLREAALKIPELLPRQPDGRDGTVIRRDDIAPPALLRRMAAEEMAAPLVTRMVPICGINNCGGRCPLVAEVSEGCVLGVLPAPRPEEICESFGGAPEKIKENVKSPWISPCARGLSYHRTFLRGDRLRWPMKRADERGSGRFVRISWGEAVETIASEMERIKLRYGPQSRYVQYAYGVSAAASGQSFAQSLMALDGGFLGRYNTYSTACISAATPYTYGTNVTGNSADDLLNSRLIILWGHNPVETVFGGYQALYMREVKRRGAEIIAVDPRASDSAVTLADRWIGLRPTTDSALMDAMAFTILEEGLQDQEFMDRFCVGFNADHMPEGFENCENYRDYAFGKYDGRPKSPEWAEPITGVAASTIRWLARKYATTKPAALIQGYGPQRHGNGEQTARSGTMLACLTGNVGIPGGWACGTGDVRERRTPSVAPAPNPYKGEIPVFLWTDAILRGREMTSLDGVRGVKKLGADIKMIFNLAGNSLVNQHSDIGRTTSILRDDSLCEFIVCSDLFMTPSARFADILLPGASMFEAENIAAPWREGDYFLYCDKSIEPPFECRFEYDWLSEVAKELGHYDEFTHGGKSLRGLLRESYEEIAADDPEMPDFETFRGSAVHRWAHRSFVAFEENVRAGLPFPTPSGKIEIFSPRLHEMKDPANIPAIPKYIPSFEGPGDPLF
ncbi:MAG: molybdopterin-dependent oxidoreductase, partial [Synergistaceae bacterium]|nr:molybdopterin-dependent oxidoreductase [Synergistaceae bacterium]